MKTNFVRFLKRIQATREDEINCSQCLDQISSYVDLELETGEAGLRMPQVHQHLGQCTVCYEEYEMLRQLAEGQEAGSADLIEQLKRGQKD